jgi:hypothetical protein
MQELISSLMRSSGAVTMFSIEKTSASLSKAEAD